MCKLVCRFMLLVRNRSLFNDNFGFRSFSVRLREVAEIRDFPLVALLVFYKCML